MPKRVHSASDRDDDTESTSNQSAPKRNRKTADDREIVRKSSSHRIHFYLYFFRINFVRKSTMPYVLINPKIVEFFVKVLFVYQAKGIFLFRKTLFFKFICFRTHAEYYTLIKQPIDLIRIQQKLRTDEYQTLEQFSDDIQLLLNNARTFYRVKEFDLNENI